MKHLHFILTIITITMLASFKPGNVPDSFDNYPVYTGNDLGANYSPAKTTFKVWAPMAAEVKLRLYDAGNGGNAIETISMQKGANGTWDAGVKKDIKNKYYTFQCMQDGKWLLERPDIYAKAVGSKGERGRKAERSA